MSGDELTQDDREALGDWWDSDWPDTAAGALGSLHAAVGAIVAAHVQAARADELEEAAEVADRVAITGLETTRPDLVAIWLRARAAALRSQDAGDGGEA